MRGSGLGLAGELLGVGERQAYVRDEIRLRRALGEPEGALEELPGRGEIPTPEIPTQVAVGPTQVAVSPTQVGVG
ncbi:MAG TPA: hypothetical protein VL242_52645, partial [Sorangium sp.]|nr:hypothetical protein [Sorangium sp.]